MFGTRELGPYVIGPSRKRVVAAGVEKDHLFVRLRLHRFQNGVDADRLDFQIHCRLEACIDGDEAVISGNLNSMPGIVKETQLGAVERADEFSQLGFETHLVEIVGQHDLKADPSQRVRYRLSVVDGIFQLGDILIGPVSDHEGNPAAGSFRNGGRCK